MLKKLILKNFRAFRLEEFEFSRLNIFVGPNNSGKSSAISALNLLAQTIGANESGAPLLLRGKYDDLGTYIDVVHGNIPRTPLSIELHFGNYEFRIEYKYRTQRREIEIVRYEIFSDDRPLFQYKARKDAYEIKYRGRKLEQILESSKKRRPIFRGLSVIDPNLRNARFFAGREKTKDLFLDENIRKEIIDIDRNISRANRRLELLFREFDTLSPFRDPPRRTFLFSGEAPTQVGRTGDKAVDILVTDQFARGKAKRGIIDQVSSFFQSTKMAKRIDVKALTSRHFEVCLVGNDGGSHNISDVGFGCSQVLPVLVGGLNLFSDLEDRYARFSEPIFVVQEPEIHLHPNAQADLGSFFVNLVGAGGQVFIETHSDNMILRIQRHVAAGQIKPDMVRVFFVQEKDGVKEVIPLDLTDDGIFKKPWPGGFFPQRQKESLELARATAPQEKIS